MIGFPHCVMTIHNTVVPLPDYRARGVLGGIFISNLNQSRKWFRSQA